MSTDPRRGVPLVGEYSLDRGRGRLLRGTEEVHLRPQAYHLLDYLVDRRGELIGKDELVQHIWQGRFVGDDSLVQCFKDVRHALGPEGARLIRTVRGRGYIFDLEAAEPVVQASGARAPAVPGGGQGAGHRQRAFWLPVAVAGLTILAVAAVAFHRSSSLRDTPIESVAVMPLVNGTGDPDLEYVIDGSTDSLINSLAQERELTVTARSTVFRFKGLDFRPQQLASEMSVQAILEGRATRRGDTMTISVALAGQAGEHLWGHQYSFRLDEIAAVQKRMAEDVAGALRRGGGRVQPAASAGSTSASGDAHLLYLRGTYHASRSNEADARKAIDFYHRAIALDPKYAPAYSGLAHAHRALAIVGQAPSREAFAEARAAAERALELNPGLAEAHRALGWIAFSFDWDWAAAERELSTAIALSPGSADAHREYAHLLSNLGRHEEALVAAGRARQLDPRSPLTNALEAQFLFYAGRYDDAEGRLRKTLEIDPEYWVAHLGLGRVAILRGRLAEATEALERAVALSDRGTEALTQLGYARAIAGDVRGARAVLEELRERLARAYVPAYSFAMILNGLGETDAALAELDRSVAEREVQATFVKVDTRWDRLRPNPRFIEILRTVGLNR